MLHVLLRFDDRQYMAKAFVLDDCGVTDALILAENAVGKRLAFPSDLQASVREVIKLNVLTGQSFRDFSALQDDLRPVIRHGQLLTDVTLFAMAQDVVETIGSHLERTMQVLRLDRTHGEAFVEALHKVRQQNVAGFYIAYVLKTKLFHQPILQSAIGSFDAAPWPGWSWRKVSRCSAPPTLGRTASCLDRRMHRVSERGRRSVCRSRKLQGSRGSRDNLAALRSRSWCFRWVRTAAASIG